MDSDGVERDFHGRSDAPGSVSAIVAHTCPLVIWVRYFFRCSSLPYNEFGFVTTWPPSAPARLIQPPANSSATGLEIGEQYTQSNALSALMLDRRRFGAGGVKRSCRIRVTGSVLHS